MYVIIRLLYLVKKKKEEPKLFVAQILEITNNEVTCLFLRRVVNRETFYFPIKEDVMTLEKTKIMRIIKDYTFRRGYLNIKEKNEVINLLFKYS